jgi:Pectate lyase superfamily protein
MGIGMVRLRARICSMSGPDKVLDAKAFGAAGDGKTDDTMALARWIGAINQAPGEVAFLPPGQYMISAPLPPVSVDSVVILGCGWAYIDFTHGSVISALPSYSPGSSGSAMLSLAGEGNRLEGICVDGGGFAPMLISVTGGHAQLTRIQAHHAAADGTCIGIASRQPGTNSAFSCWITDSLINGLTTPGKATPGSIGVSLACSDAIIQGTKWDNNQVCLQIQPGAAGAQILGCHFTPDSGGQNAIWFDGGASDTGSFNNVLIASCRFDNSVGSPVQISPGMGRTPANIAIANCLFQSKKLTKDKYALVAVDTTSHSVNGLSITNNACYGDRANLPAHFLAAQTQDGTRSAHPAKIASAGCLCSGNNAWVGTSFYAANSTPTVGRGNMVTTDGSTYSAVPDI